MNETGKANGHGRDGAPTKVEEKFSLYDAVCIRRLPAHCQIVNDAFNLRPPRVGDIAFIVEIYADPPGYELECSDEDGITQWMIAFAPGALELERVGRPSLAGCQFRYFFDAGSGTCLWSANETARARFGYPVMFDDLDLPEDVAARAHALIARFNASIDWDNPAGPTTWSVADHACFTHDAAALLDRLRDCTPGSVTIIDETGRQDADHEIPSATSVRHTARSAVMAAILLLALSGLAVLFSR